MNLSKFAKNKTYKDFLVKLDLASMGTRITQIKRISTDFFQAVELISASIRQIRVICVPIVVIIRLFYFL